MNVIDFFTVVSAGELGKRKRGRPAKMRVAEAESQGQPHKSHKRRRTGKVKKAKKKTPVTPATPPASARDHSDDVHSPERQPQQPQQVSTFAFTSDHDHLIKQYSV